MSSLLGGPMREQNLAAKMAPVWFRRTARGVDGPFFDRPELGGPYIHGEAIVYEARRSSGESRRFLEEAPALAWLALEPAPVPSEDVDIFSTRRLPSAR